MYSQGTGKNVLLSFTHQFHFQPSNIIFTLLLQNLPKPDHYIIPFSFSLIVYRAQKLIKN